MKIFSHIASWVFLPLFMPVYGLLLAMYVPNLQDYALNKDSLFFLNENVKISILVLFFAFGCVAPGLSFLVLHKRNIITTIDMEDKSQRKIPLLIMLAYCLILYAVFVLKFPGYVFPKFIYGVPLSGAIVTGVSLFITRWMKISLHAGGAGILTGFIFAYTYNMVLFPFWIVIAPIVASGLVITARLYLNRHTPREVYLGWSLAVLITFSTNQLVPYIL
ncbi:MAG: phosphatase PAP2 family protein [Bacteroidota bacterium]